MITIAIVNAKGGTGKTTLASALAVRAARDSKRVAMVDMDPQHSLAQWWMRRGKGDNPRIFADADSAAGAVEALSLDGWEWCFLDGPPAELALIEEMVGAADFALIPMKTSASDLLSTNDAVSVARDVGAKFLVCFNDVGPRERHVEKAREFLFSSGVPIAETQITHRASHISGMNAGKSAAEVNGGKDTAAAEEIDALWAEVKAAAQKAARAARKGGRP